MDRQQLPPRQILETLRVEDVTPYLRRKGWQQVESANKNLLAFELLVEGQEPQRVWLPVRDDFRDSKLRLAEALADIAAVEHVSIEELLTLLRTFDRDIIRCRWIHSAWGASIPLQQAPELIKHLRDFVAAARCQEEEPMPFYGRLPSIGSEFAQKCWFGQTFVGSFGVTVEVPVPPRADTLPSIDPPAVDAPLERRVVRRIALGLKLAQAAAFQDHLEAIKESIGVGLNGNMCDTLVEMGKLGQGAELEIGVQWSPVWREDGELGPGEPVLLTPRTFSYLDAAARELRKPSENLPVTISGRIVQLRSDEPPTEQQLPGAELDRHVQLLWGKPGRSAIRLRIALRPDEYLQACDAHRDGRHVTVEGIPLKEGKNWVLTKRTRFEIEG